MTITPRDFQQELLSTASTTMMLRKSIVLVAPCGAGKTAIAAFIIKRAYDRGRRVLMTVHRDFLVDQTAEMLRLVGVPFGIVAAGYTPDYKQRIQIASIDTLKHRLDFVGDFDLVIPDECHHTLAAGWARVVKHFMDGGAKVLGLTATPVRLDGRGLGEFYEEIVLGPTVKWLIENGYLCGYRAFAPSTPDMSGVHIRMGDYVQKEAEAVVDKPTLTGDAIREYKKHANGKRAVAFCVSVEHAKHVAAMFNDTGIPAAHIEANTPKAERKRILDAFAKGEILVLTSVNIFGEGYDLPLVECVILLRPTQSLSLFIQMIGRALRALYAAGWPITTKEQRLAAIAASQKPFAIILDHSGGLMNPNLGLPDQDRQWSLEGADKKKRKKQQESSVPIRQCPRCFAVFPPAPVCPACGHVLPVQSREIEQVDGDLTELTPEMMAIIRERNKREVQRARTLDALMSIEKQRGYKPGWARAVFMSRQHSGDHRALAQYEAFMR